jgi:molecular chaperone Hsp33
MPDELVHFQLMDGRARAVIVNCTETTRIAVGKHGLDPISTIGLGRAMGCTAILGSTLKHPGDFIHLAFMGTGPLQKIKSEINGVGDIRGFTAHPQLSRILGPEDPVPLTVGEALGHEGQVILTKGTMGDKEPYRSINQFADGEIATDVTKYLFESDQIPSAVAAGVKLSTAGEVLGAGACLVQQLGGGVISDEELAGLEQKMRDIMISDRIASGQSVDEAFAFIAGDDSSAMVLSRKPVRFHCSCTRERMANSLFALGKDELEAIIKEVGMLQSQCPYCSNKQTFKLEELLAH